MKIVELLPLKVYPVTLNYLVILILMNSIYKCITEFSSGSKSATEISYFFMVIPKKLFLFSKGVLRTIIFQNSSENPV